MYMHILGCAALRGGMGRGGMYPVRRWDVALGSCEHGSTGGDGGRD